MKGEGINYDRVNNIGDSISLSSELLSTLPINTLFMSENKNGRLCCIHNLIPPIATKAKTRIPILATVGTIVTGLELPVTSSHVRLRKLKPKS